MVAQNGRPPYDAILLASFGGPEAQADVLPFLRNVTRGRGIPDERLEEVAKHYRHFGGVSPINQQNRDLKAALEAELERRGVQLPVYWGNRHWEPYFSDALAAAHSDGHTRILGLVTSAYTSYSGVEAYSEDLVTALDQAGLSGQMVIDRVREFFDHPGFVNPFLEGVGSAVVAFRSEGVPDEAIRLLFVTHSIPTEAANHSGEGFGEGGAYVAQHLATADLIARTVAPELNWSLSYQSRSGDPRTPWLEPDINDVIADLAVEGKTAAVIVVPIGFVSDHMEVQWDLDNEALETAAEHGIAMRRVPTPGIHPAFVAGLVDLCLERINGEPDSARQHLTELGPWPDHPSITGSIHKADEPHA